MTNISTLPWGDGAGSLWFNRNLSHRHLYSWSQVSNTFSTVKSVTYFGTSVYQRPDADEMGNDLPAGEAGEILIRGVNVLSGYWRNETATRETLRDGWYHSGDIGYRDEAGYYFVVDRKKNMIKSGGESIYPTEIERVLFEHPAVVEVAVFGVPDDKWQEIPVALVVTAKDASQSAEELRSFAQNQFALYKVPHHIHFLDALPKNAMGKVQHFLLKEQWKKLLVAGGG